MRQRAYDDFDFLLGFVSIGTADKPRHVRRLDLALERLREWSAIRQPPKTEIRGGSSSPTELSERHEDVALQNSILRDAPEARRIVKELEHYADQLYRIVARYTETVHPSKLPAETLPGCVSCSRETVEKGVRYTSHFSPVDDKNYAKQELCRWCGDHAKATADEQGLDFKALARGELLKLCPPLKAVELYQESAQKAGKWLARNLPVKA